MKKFLKYFGLLLLAVLIYVGFTTYPKLDILSGFAAKSVASGHFIDNRPLEIIQQGDNDIDMVRLAKLEVDKESKFATASVYGLKKRKAVYREGLGATLVTDDFDETQPYLVPKRTKIENNLPFPYGNLEPKDTVFKEVNYGKLQKAVADAFDKPGFKTKRTRALLIIYKDRS